MPDLDLYDRDWPIWTYAEITPPAKFVHDEDGRRGIGGQLAGLGRLHRLGRRAAALAAVHRRARQFLSRSSTRPWCCPTSRSAAHARLSRVVIDRGVRIPEGLVVGEDPELDAKRFRRTEKRHLPDHPADDRPARTLMPMQVLAVASEFFPLIKTGGLADVAGALPRRWRAQGVEMRTLVPAIPR